MAIKEKIIEPGQGRFVNVIGDEHSVKISGEDNGGAFTMIEQNTPVGIGVPMHVHSREDEIFYVVQGKVEFTLKDRKIIAGPGTTVYLPKGVPHRFEIVGDQKARIFLTAIPAGIEKMFEKLGQLPPGPPDPEKVFNICQEFGVQLL